MAQKYHISLWAELDPINLTIVFPRWIPTSKNLQLQRDDFRWPHASPFHLSVLCNTPLSRQSPLPDDVLQMFVDGEENTVVLINLTPMTEYIVRVYGVIGEESSEPLKGTETTCKLAFPAVYRTCSPTVQSHCLMKLTTLTYLYHYHWKLELFTCILGYIQNFTSYIPTENWIWNCTHFPPTFEWSSLLQCLIHKR